MPSCASLFCSARSGKGKMFHRFPRNPERRRLWENNVGRIDWKATDNSFLCSAHFQGDQYELYRLDKVKKLRPNAIPTIFKNRKSSNLLVEIIQAFPNKQITENYVKEASSKRVQLEHSYGDKKSKYTKPLIEDCDTETGMDNEFFNVLEVPGCEATSKTDKSPDKLIIPLKVPVTESASVAVRFVSLLPANKKKSIPPSVTLLSTSCPGPSFTNRITQLEHKITLLKKTLAQERRQKRNMFQQKQILEKHIAKVFNQDQLEKLSHKSTRGVKWSPETVRKGLKLLAACGVKGYELLIAQNHPLPSTRTLRRLRPSVQSLQEAFDQVIAHNGLEDSPEKNIGDVEDEKESLSEPELNILISSLITQPQTRNAAPKPVAPASQDVATVSKYVTSASQNVASAKKNVLASQIVAPSSTNVLASEIVAPASQNNVSDFRNVVSASHIVASKSHNDVSTSGNVADVQKDYFSTCLPPNGVSSFQSVKPSSLCVTRHASSTKATYTQNIFKQNMDLQHTNVNAGPQNGSILQDVHRESQSLQFGAQNHYTDSPTVLQNRDIESQTMYSMAEDVHINTHAFSPNFPQIIHPSPIYSQSGPFGLPGSEIRPHIPGEQHGHDTNQNMFPIPQYTQLMSRNSQSNSDTNVFTTIQNTHSVQQNEQMSASQRNFTPQLSSHRTSF